MNRFPKQRGTAELEGPHLRGKGAWTPRLWWAPHPASLVLWGSPGPHFAAVELRALPSRAALH